jgi:hypothetical protein
VKVKSKYTCPDPEVMGAIFEFEISAEKAALNSLFNFADQDHTQNTGLFMSHFRPKCINHGCNKPAVPMRGKVGEEGVRYRVFCTNCHKNSYSDYPLDEGVKRYKTGTCSNVDGSLGFPCVVNWKIVKSSGLRISTEVDHINGDRNDNRPENLQELCPTCHSEKGKRNGDHNGHR